MKIKLIYVGKTNKDFLIEGEQEYIKRLKHYVPLEIVALPDIKNAKNRTKEDIKNLEAEAILKKINATDNVVLLDEQGKTFSSIEFSNFLQKKLNSEIRNLVFVIGGPYGFGAAVYQRANSKFALSRLTFSHLMVRLFFLEQLYRAFTIMKNEPYHHE